MPKTITVIIETDFLGDHEIWECAYTSFEDAKRDAIEHLEDMRRQERGAWTSISYKETGPAHARTGEYAMGQYDGPIHITLTLQPLTLI